MSTQSAEVYRTPGAARPLYWALLLLSLIPLCVVLPMAPVKVGIAAIAAWVALIWVTISFLQRQFHYAVLLWVAVYPYCYYLLSFPAEHSIFTADRAFIVLLPLKYLSRHGEISQPLPFRVTYASVAIFGASTYWFAFFRSLPNLRWTSYRFTANWWRACLCRPSSASMRCAFFPC